MTTNRVEIDVADRDFAHQIAGALQELIEPAPEAVTLFEAVSATSPGWRIEAYFAHAPDIPVLARELGVLLGKPLPRINGRPIPDENWVALSQAALPPVRAGRFTVHGSHDRGRVPHGPWSILIDAGEAFGTAHHATTYGCLEAIDRVTRRRPYRDVLDLGCGSGVLAIAVSRSLPHARISASDLDQQSVSVARENMRNNGAATRIRVLRAAGLDAPTLRRAAPFDLVIANILADPLIRLSGAITRAVQPAGTLILSGLLIPQAPEVIASYVAKGFALTRHARITGWSTLTLTKRAIARPARRT